MEVSREKALAEFYGIDMHWVDHIRTNWDSMKDYPACGCEPEEGCCGDSTMYIHYCDGYKDFLEECHKYLHEGLSSHEYRMMLARKAEAERRDLAAQALTRDEKRLAEWEELKYRGLTP